MQTALPAASTRTQGVEAAPRSPPHPAAQSRAFVFIPGRIYYFCINTRFLPAGPNASPSSSAAPTIIGLIDTFTWAQAASTNVVAGPNWQQLCMNNVRVTSTTSAYFILPLGVAAGTWHIDDASLVFIDTNPPAPSPSPSPVPSPSPLPSPSPAPSPSPRPSPSPSLWMNMMTSSFAGGVNSGTWPARIEAFVLCTCAYVCMLCQQNPRQRGVMPLALLPCHTAPSPSRRASPLSQPRGLH